MRWEKVIGHQKQKQWLQNSIDEDRVAHAQIISAKEGHGALQFALAFARAVILKDRETESATDHLLPDMHFYFPTTSTDSVKSDHVESKSFQNEFREFVTQFPYGSTEKWLQFLGVEKKQGTINVRDAATLVSDMSLKSFDGGYKVAIIWQAHLMNGQTANKLLKLIEEPSDKSLILLVTSDAASILGTIRSRCQLLELQSPLEDEIVQYLKQEKGLEESEAKQLAFASRGDLHRLQLLLEEENPEAEFENYFILWVRSAFQARKKAAVLSDLIQWTAEIATWSREKQKGFIFYCLNVFRQAMLQNYGTTELVYAPISSNGFKWEGFSKFISGANIVGILEELNKAHYHIERNANAKMVFLDLSIQLTRLLHKKD